MTAIKIAVWNMEWLNDLFTTEPDDVLKFKPDDAHVRGPKPPWQKENPPVLERKNFLSKGLHDLDCDVIVVVEGPNKSEELQLFFDELAPGTWKCFAQASQYPSSPGGRNLGSSQCVGIALRTDRDRFREDAVTVFDSMDAESGLIHSATEPFFLDISDDKVPEWFRYERRPLYVEIHPKTGPVFRVLGLHLKSKGIFSAYEWSRWWELAHANRERLIAQCRHLREAFLDVYLSDSATREIPLIVCGDINDGPGFDTSEMRLNVSGVETLMGSVWEPQLALGNALYDMLSEKKKADMNFSELSTTRFADPIFNDTYHKVWIDHILYTRNAPSGWVSAAKVVRKTGDDFEYWKISDHFPVVASVDLGAT